MDLKRIVAVGGTIEGRGHASVKHVLDEVGQGDFVELGVYKGNSAVPKADI